jgi:hypothetical protein
VNPITLRGLPPAVAGAIRRRAGERKLSLNKAVISLLEEGLGIRERASTTYHDLDSLGGAWVREEADAFEASLREQRAVDPDVWR